MRRSTTHAVAYAALLGLAFLMSVPSMAKQVTPGDYCGASLVDRWDECIVTSGSRLMVASGDAARLLRDWAMRDVRINASVIAPSGFGDGNISKCKYLGTPKIDETADVARNLFLQVTQTSRDGEPPSFRLSLQYEGRHAVTILADRLAPILLCRKKGTAVTQAIISGEKIAAGISPGDRGTSTHNWSVAGPATVNKTLKLQPNQTLKIQLNLTLPMGEYDLFIGYGSDEFNGWCAASGQSYFDVDADGNAKFVPADPAVMDNTPSDSLVAVYPAPPRWKIFRPSASAPIEQSGSNDELDAHFILLVKSKSEVTEKNLYSWAQRAKKENDQNSTLKNRRDSDLIRGKIGDRNIVEYGATGEMFDSQERYRIIMLELGDRYCQLVCYSKPDNWKEAQLDFESLLKNLKPVSAIQGWGR